MPVVPCGQWREQRCQGGRVRLDIGRSQFYGIKKSISLPGRGNLENLSSREKPAGQQCCPRPCPSLRPSDGNCPSPLCSSASRGPGGGSQLGSQGASLSQCLCSVFQVAFQLPPTSLAAREEVQDQGTVAPCSPILHRDPAPPVRITAQGAPGSLLSKTPKQELSSSWLLHADIRLV